MARWGLPARRLLVNAARPASFQALPSTLPQIEASSNKPGREMAAIGAGNLVPKEMHGWVAVDRDTLTKLVGKFMMTGAGSRTSKK